MPTASSWTETRRSATDVAALVRFRVAGLRGRSRRVAPVAVGVLLLLTVAACVLPVVIGLPMSRAQVADLLPTAYLSLLVVSVVSTATSGGGRELLPRDQAVAFPVSPTTDHLGALVMAPLNIAWLLECWAVLAGTAYAVGPRAWLPLALLPALAWLAAATALAQVLAWAVEWVRRGPRGTLLVRGATAALLAGVGVLVATGRLQPLLDHDPTVPLARAVVRTGTHPVPALLALLALVAVTVVAVAAGGWLAGRVARRSVREEQRVESSTHAARAHPTSDLAALLRTDRAAVWRSVPMRRGILVLALLPGLVALGGSFHWDALAVFPGLVASGGSLVFGVNAWSIDGRGALWRESLPVDPRLTFVARAVVVAEVLVVTSLVTVLLASLRAGRPTTAQLVAVLAAVVVVTVQVVATSMRWSVRSPYAVDLRSARATPAPPLVMVGYSSRLALSTTFTGLLLSSASVAGWQWVLVVCVPFLAWSTTRLARAARAWSTPATRSRVVATVAA